MAKFQDPTVNTTENTITYPFLYCNDAKVTELVLKKSDLQQILSVVDSSLTFDNALTRTGNNVRLGGALSIDTEIAMTSKKMMFVGDGRVGIGVSTGATLDARLTVKNQANSTDNSVIAMIQSAVTGESPYFGFYTFTWQDHIGIANYNTGTGANSTGYYGENRWDNIAGTAISLEQRGGGATSQVGSITTVPYSQLGDFPNAMGIKHYGNGRAFTIRAFATALDTNYNKWLSNDNWESIYWLNQAAKTRAFFAMDNQAAYTNPFVDWVNVGGANSTGTFFRMIIGTGNSGTGQEILHDGSGRALLIDTKDADQLGRAGFQVASNGNVGVGYYKAVDLSTESTFNVAGSHQYTTTTYDADLDLSLPNVGGTKAKGQWHHTIVMNPTTERTVTLSDVTTQTGREYRIVNLSNRYVINIKCKLGDSFWDLTTSKRLEPQSSMVIQSIDTDASSTFSLRWAIISAAEQTSAVVFDSDKDLDIANTPGDKFKGMFNPTIVMNPSVARTITLANSLNALNGEFKIVNISSTNSITVNTRLGDSYWDGTTSKVISPNSSMTIQSVNTDLGTGLTIKWIISASHGTIT